MEYYFTPKQYVSGSSLTIIDDEAKHLGRVLRKQSGSEIFVTDGEGNLYRTRISGVTKEIINCDVIEKFRDLNEPKRRITLYQSLLKKPDRFEFVIEKAVELGIAEIRPVITEHVINKSTEKVERWQLIAMAAMKQSQRCILPKVHVPVKFEEALKSARSELKLIADERDFDTPNAFKIDSGINEESIDVFIGPEGGFTLREVDEAAGSGCRIINLGPRKYRSETAAILLTGLLLNV